MAFSTNKSWTKTVLNTDTEIKAESLSLKYIGIVIDSKLKSHEELKKILQKMACGIKVLRKLGESLRVKTRRFLLKETFLSHIYYSDLTLSGLQQMLIKTLE